MESEAGTGKARHAHDDHRPHRTADLTADTVAPVLRTELPGPVAREIIARDEAVTSPSLTRVYPLVVRRARGCVIEDVDGNRFLDFNAGIAVAAAGHAHPAVNAAIHAQVDDVLHYCSSDFYLPAYADVCERLAAVAPMPDARVFLCNSGTEAVEAALKLARHHTGRPNAIAFFGAFHGRSLGSLSLTASKARQRAGLRHRHAGHVPRPVRRSVRRRRALTGAAYIEQVLFTKLTDPRDVAAIFVEPIQGEGGYIVPPAGWLADLRRLCDEHGILLVVDEVQSGVGRTGTMWASRARRRRARHHVHRQGPGQRPAAGRHRRPRRRHGLGAGRARLDVRRQPRRLRRRTGHARPRRRRSWPPTPPPSALTCSTGCRRWPPTSR